MGVDGVEDRTGRGALRGSGPSVGRATKSERPSVDGGEETEEGRGRGGGAAGAMVLT